MPNRRSPRPAACKLVRLGGEAGGWAAADRPGGLRLVSFAARGEVGTYTIIHAGPPAVARQVQSLIIRWVPTTETAGALLVFEHAGMGRGGPPRHFHHEQDEWFYVTKGEFAFEVGDERFTLRPGDSLFAPRMIPHVWAYVGDGPGTLLLAAQPAGALEAFFMENCAMDRLPTPEEAERSFAAHGMKIVGPPLEVG